MAQNNNAMSQSHRLTVNSNGGIHVPAAVQSELGGCYGQTIEVGMETPDAPTERVVFSRDVHSGGGITIPVGVRRMANIEPGDQIEARFYEPLPDGDELEEILEEAESEWSEEDSLGAPEGSSDEEVEESVEETEEDEGLAELFG